MASYLSWSSITVLPCYSKLFDAKFLRGYRQPKVEQGKYLLGMSQLVVATPNQQIHLALGEHILCLQQLLSVALRKNQISKQVESES